MGFFPQEAPGSDHGDPILDVDVVRIAALVHLSGSSVAQDEAAHGGCEERHDEEDVQVGIVIPTGTGAGIVRGAGAEDGPVYGLVQGIQHCLEAAVPLLRPVVLLHLLAKPVWGSSSSSVSPTDGVPRVMLGLRMSPQMVLKAWFDGGKKTHIQPQPHWQSAEPRHPPCCSLH